MLGKFYFQGFQEKGIIIYEEQLNFFIVLHALLFLILASSSSNSLHAWVQTFPISDTISCIPSICCCDPAYSCIFFAMFSKSVLIPMIENEGIILCTAEYNECQS